MRVLFDQNAPRPLATFLPNHQVTTSAELNWSTLKNGDLIQAAEERNFDVLITADKNLFYQQNLTRRKLAIVILPSGRWPKVKPYIAEVVRAVDQATPGSFREIVQLQGSKNRYPSG